MKTLKRALVIAAVAVALVAIPIGTAEAFWWGPGYGVWRNAYVYDPAYRWGSPATRTYIRDLYLRGPGYADWHQARLYGYNWW